MYFRVWGNYGHTPDTWHGHVIGQRTSQYGQKATFTGFLCRSQMQQQQTFSTIKTTPEGGVNVTIK